MRTYQIRLTDAEALLMERVLQKCFVDVTPEALLESCLMDRLNSATSDPALMNAVTDNAADRQCEYENNAPAFGTLTGCTMRALPWGQKESDENQVWFLEVGRTDQDFRAGGVEYQTAVRVEVCGKHLRLLRHILSGHRPKLEYLVSEAFNKAMEDTLKGVQAEQWRASQRQKAMEMPAVPVE